MTNVKELTDYNPDGTRIGQAAADKIAFYGATPATQPTSANQAAVATTSATAVATTAATSSSPYGYTSSQANAIISAVNTNITDIASLKTLANQIRSDLVTLGLLKGS